jgi:hypothetical protein
MQCNSNGRPTRKADNLTAICEPLVYKMWEPRCLIALWPSEVCYYDRFTFVERKQSDVKNRGPVDTIYVK